VDEFPLSPTALRGHRILVVEDNALLAISLVDMLMESGAEVVGPAVTLDEAESFAVGEALSAALLDIRLDDEEVWPVARVLATRGVPFVFSTGHFDATSLPAEWAERPILTKPAGRRKIITALTDLIPRH
jgi:two-component system, chemotaxis family, sensor kinase Cph1